MRRRLDLPDRPPDATAVADDADVCETVVAAAGEATDTPVLDLPPLEATVDTDALDAVFAGRDARGAVAFQYAGCLVAVDADGTVEVY